MWRLPWMKKGTWLKRLWFSCLGLFGRVFASGPGDRGSITGRVIPKTQKMVLDTSWLNTQYYKVRINQGKGVANSPPPGCSSYWKGAFESSSPTIANCLNLLTSLKMNWYGRNLMAEFRENTKSEVFHACRILGNIYFFITVRKHSENL